MISRRNFITITLLMFVLLFLFLFSGAYKDSLNEYDVNIYAGTADQKALEKKYQSDALFRPTDQETDGYIAYVGRDKNLNSVIRQWCRYERRNYRTSASCDELSFDAKKPPYMICLDGKSLTVSDIDLLTKWADQNIHLVFCNMPDTRITMRKAIKDLMGIRSIREENVHLEGIVLHEGFLLGGGYTYTVRDEMTAKLQDLTLTTDWYEMAAGTKAYMTGLLDEEVYGETKNEYLPAIVWRNSVKDSKVFVVNGDYMESVTGMGFLSAMVNEIEDYTLYPVLNAQNMVIVNYPSFTPENNDEMLRLYSRDSYRVLREIIWPGLTSVLMNTDSKMTCMLNTKMNYDAAESPSVDDLVFFMKLLREQEAEAGISCDQTSNVVVALKLKTDEEFLKGNLPKYEFQTAYVAGEFPSTMASLLHLRGFNSIHTYLTDFEPTGDLVSLLDKGEVVLSTVNNGDSHLYSEDIREKAVETVLGYSVVTEDLQHIIYPQGPEDEWQHVYRDFASYTDTFYDPFDAFEELTLSQTATRAKQFLTTDYTQRRQKNLITINSNYDSGYFVLRTHDEEIKDIEGGEYKKIEKDAWLIRLEEKQCRLLLAKEQTNTYESREKK